MLEFWCQTRSKKITKARWVWRGGQDSLEPSSVPAYYITWSFLCPTWMIIMHLSPKGYSGRFFFRTDKGKKPQSVMFWGCGTDSLLPPQSSRFIGCSVKINMKHGNAKTLSVSDHLCGRLIPKKSKADTELSPNVFEVICPISEASEATSTKRSFFFFFFHFRPLLFKKNERGTKETIPTGDLAVTAEVF